MILLSIPLKNDPPETMVSICFSSKLRSSPTKIVNSKSLKEICRQLLSTMNVLEKESGQILRSDSEFVSYSNYNLVYLEGFPFWNSKVI